MSGQSGGSTQDSVELRVHGVSGTPAEDMLACPTEFLELEGGDKYAGFYRCRPCDCEDAGDDSTAGPPVREAYSWGGLTSGSATRALWLLFLPFILINLAHWMLPPSATGRRSPAVAVTALRLLALSLTLTLMLASVQVAVDIVGWQCAATARCGSRLGPLSGLIDAPDGVRVAVTALPVALMLILLLLLGRANPASAGAAAIESQPPSEKATGPTKEPPPDSAVETKDIRMAETNFWNPDDSVKRLRACHVMAWAAGLGAVVLMAPVRLVDDSPVLRSACVVLLAVNVFVLLAGIVMTWSTSITGRGGPSADAWNKWMPIMQWASVGLLAVTLIVVGSTKMAPHAQPADLLTEPTHLPGLRYTVYGLLGVQGLTLIVLFVATARCMNMKWLRRGISGIPRAVVWPVPQLIWWLRKKPVNVATGDEWAPTLHGFGAPLVATIAILAAGGFSTGVGLWSAQYLGDPVPSTKAAQCLAGFRAKIMESPATNVETLFNACNEKKQQQLPPLPATPETQLANYNADTPLIVPPAYFVAALVFFGLLISLLAAVALIWFVAIPKWTNEALAEVQGDYPDEQKHPRLIAIARARAVASLTDYAPTILARLTGLAVLAIISLGVPFTFIYFKAGFDNVPITVPVLSYLGVASISATAAGIVALAAAAFRNRKQRRVVGILWDVITFWPRANHPLTPPCYAERTVPDLKKQLDFLTEEPASRVVLSAHSQGSIIAAATVLQKDVDSDQVALLTFGCPLRRLYGRNFPAYFGERSLDRLAAKQRNQWLNLWCATDPIGSWVFSEGGDVAKPTTLEPLKFTFDFGVVDHRLLDVYSLKAKPRGMEEPICGHSGFWTRKEYEGAVGVLTT